MQEVCVGLCLTATNILDLVFIFTLLLQESLQQRLEMLEEVERAFVHIDYEAEHDPTTEHKLV